MTEEEFKSVKPGDIFECISPVIHAEVGDGQSWCPISTQFRVIEFKHNMIISQSLTTFYCYNNPKAQKIYEMLSIITLKRGYSQYFRIIKPEPPEPKVYLSRLELIEVD